MPHRAVPPPDFRYVGLAPGLSPAHMALVAAGASTGLTGTLLLSAGPDTTSLVISLLAGGVVALSMGRQGAFRLMRHARAMPVAMAIVPWGVLVRPDEEGEARVLRWAGVRAVSVDSIHTRDTTGSPHTSWSFVTVETERERLVGRAAGQVSLERLVAHLDDYARESSLPVALGLEGGAASLPTGFEPAVRSLLAGARRALSEAEGADLLALGLDSYRGGPRSLTGETVRVLRAVLREEPGDDGDRRALAALLAGELGARTLEPELLRLVTTAHPVVAACARASALRLGVEPTRAGALLELAPFLHEDDLEALEDWIGAPAGEEASA